MDDLESWTNSGKVVKATPSVEGSDLPLLPTSAGNNTLLAKIVLAERCQTQTGKGYWGFHCIVKWGTDFFRYRHAVFAPHQFSTLATMAGLPPGAKPQDTVGKKVMISFVTKGEYVNGHEISQVQATPPALAPAPEPKLAVPKMPDDIPF